MAQPLRPLQELNAMGGILRELATRLERNVMDIATADKPRERRGAESGVGRVKELLLHYPQEEFTAGMVVLAAGVNLGTARQTLSRLAKSGYAVRLKAGCFKLAEGHSDER